MPFDTAKQQRCKQMPTKLFESASVRSLICKSGATLALLGLCDRVNDGVVLVSESSATPPWD